MVLFIYNGGAKMLLYYKTSNFSCLKNEVNFSLKPGRVTERFEDNVTIINNNLKISKIAVIAGENAGGKTSFMVSLDFFKTLIMGNMSKALKVFCHNYDPNIPQSFEICVVISDKIYTYKLKIDSYSMISEELFIRNASQSTKQDIQVFLRKRKNLKLIQRERLNIVESEIETGVNTSIIPKKYRELLNSSSSSDKLLITVLDTLDFDLVKPFVNWIKEKLIIDTPKNSYLSKFEQLKENENKLQILHDSSFLEIFRLVDSSIINIDIDDQEPFKDTKIIRKRSDDSELITKLEDDSTGVKDFFNKAINIWKVINNDATLFADEMDKVLNVVLASKVLSYIKGSEHNGQFIFSTHNALHLNTIDFMKEQIFFINKNIDSLSSELYSLADFKEYRYSQPDVYLLYLRGLFGAVPK